MSTLIIGDEGGGAPLALPVSVADGGTGAANATSARQNLGVAGLWFSGGPPVPSIHNYAFGVRAGDAWVDNLNSASYKCVNSGGPAATWLRTDNPPSSGVSGTLTVTPGANGTFIVTDAPWFPQPDANYALWALAHDEPLSFNIQSKAAVGASLQANPLLDAYTGYLNPLPASMGAPGLAMGGGAFMGGGRPITIDLTLMR